MAYKRYLKNRRLIRDFDVCDQLWIDLNIDRINRIEIQNKHVSQSILKMLIGSIDKFIKYLNNSIDGLVDIGIMAFHEFIQNKPKYKNDTMQLLNDDFVKQHNQLIHKESHDIINGIPNAIKCVVENTTQNQYRFWRQRVCEI